MFMDWNDQYSANDYTTQSDLQVQYKTYQPTTGTCQRITTKNFTICMEIQKTLNSLNNPEKEEWNQKSQHA